MTETARVTTRWFVRTPLLVGVLLIAGAIALTLAGDDLGFFSYLLMIVGGWCLGFALVNTTLDMRSAVNGAVLHAAVAVVLAALLYVVIEHAGDVLAELPAPLRAVVLVLQIAAVPAAGWIWLGLLGRVSALFRRKDAAKRPAPEPPEWERNDSGDGSVVRFPGIRMPLRVLSWWIAAVVLVVGLGGTALLIALDDLIVDLGARVAVILIGVLLALPAYLLVMRVLRRRTVACAVAFGDDELRLRVGDESFRVPFRELESLTWRSRSEYARIEVAAPGVDLSVFSGLARPPKGRTSELPPLPRRVFRRLELCGFAVERRRRGEVVSFRRAV